MKIKVINTAYQRHERCDQRRLLQLIQNLAFHFDASPLSLAGPCAHRVTLFLPRTRIRTAALTRLVASDNVFMHASAQPWGPMKILFVASEGLPYSKTGGLADVVEALPKALREMGHDVAVLLPRYRGNKFTSTLISSLSIALGDTHALSRHCRGAIARGRALFFRRRPCFFRPRTSLRRQERRLSR